MGVHPAEVDQAEVFEPAGAGHSLVGRSAGEPEPELRVVLTGAHVLVGVGLHPGCDPQQDGGGLRSARGQAFEAVELVERIDHDARHRRCDRGPQLVVGLVVAVHHEPLGGNARAQGDVQLAAGGDVEVEALLVGQRGHGPAQEGLGGVGDALTPCVAGLSAPDAQMGFVVDEQGRAEVGRQLADVDAADLEAAGRTDGRRQGEQMSRERTAGQVSPLGASTRPDRAGRGARTAW